VEEVRMADRLKGKVAVVTGAAPRGEGVGNGMACAIMFAREGAKVVLVNRDAGRAEALARQIAQEGGEAAVFAGDVTEPAAAEAMANFAVERYGRLDVLHNNVGVGVPGTVETVKLEDWHRVLDANLTSAMLCSKFAIPKMRSGGGGSPRSFRAGRSPSPREASQQSVRGRTGLIDDRSNRQRCCRLARCAWRSWSPAWRTRCSPPSGAPPSRFSNGSASRSRSRVRRHAAASST
jgi:NAD(P)-dependent dehydrogenase (short-subunit alcohol dehydrogenase family)